MRKAIDSIWNLLGRPLNHTGQTMLLTLFFSSSTAAWADLSSQEVAALRHLLYQDCGSCHGLHLTGGLGPAITRTALQSKPTGYLFTVIAKGIPGTPMPPWESLLSEKEIQWLITELKGPSTQ